MKIQLETLMLFEVWSKSNLNLEVQDATSKIPENYCGIMTDPPITIVH